MIKKYFSKYTGQQIDEAVSALIENNVRIEDLNQEVVDLINSKANEQDLAALQKEIEDNQIKVVEIPIGILQKAINEETLTAEELAFFTSDYKIYKCAVPLEGAEELGLQMYFVTSVTTDNTVALSSHLYNVIIDFTTGKVELEVSVDLEVVDIKEKVSNLESRTNSLETEVSNVSDVALNAEYLASNLDDSVEDLKKDLVGEIPTAIPTSGRWESFYVRKISQSQPLYKEFLKVCQNLDWDLSSGCEYELVRTDFSRLYLKGDFDTNTQTVSNVIVYFDISNIHKFYGEDLDDRWVGVNEVIVSAGSSNELLKNFISTNWIETGRVGTLEEKTLYLEQEVEVLGETSDKVNNLEISTLNLKQDLTGGEANPAPVPSSGIFQNLYVKKLSMPTYYTDDPRFIELCEQLTFSIGSTCSYTVFRSASFNFWIGGYWNSNLKKVEKFWMSTGYSGDESKFTDTGDELHFLDINEEITYAGTQNDLLTEYISITPFTASKGRVGELEEKVDTLETAIGDINSLLDQINGEVM